MQGKTRLQVKLKTGNQKMILGTCGKRLIKRKNAFLKILSIRLSIPAQAGATIFTTPPPAPKYCLWNRVIRGIRPSALKAIEKATERATHKEGNKTYHDS